jgi:hypothetical protein
MHNGSRSGAEQIKNRLLDEQLSMKLPGKTIEYLISPITGMNPKASFGNFIASSLRGIIPMLMQDSSPNKF